ncbi:MAG TPA: hypothetical protein PKD64_15050 [Pirellulaceae bacterium]|nr:hypothetical protein [Pirellulaceae bacterium]HMO93501.1 hypothetical protein [Pirellulaceae bacterium]HMP70406.1 hypothetical protein [Pirellulaceae bacterium]
MNNSNRTGHAADGRPAAKPVNGMKVDLSEMKNDEASQRELLIHRLVNNELTFSERREVLLKAESWDNGWREIALAFVEEQVLSNAFSCPKRAMDHSDFTAPKEDGVVDHVGRIVAQSSATPPVFAAEQAECDLAVIRPSQRKRFSPLAHPRMVMAATILLSVALGAILTHAYLERVGPGLFATRTEVADRQTEMSQPNVNDAVAMSDKLSVSQPEGLANSISQPMVAASHEVVRFLDQDSGAVLDIPLIDLQSLVQFPEFQYAEDLASQLKTSGYRLEPQVEYLTGSTANEKDVVIPVRRFSIKPAMY